MPTCRFVTIAQGSTATSHVILGGSDETIRFEGKIVLTAQELTALVDEQFANFDHAP